MQPECTKDVADCFPELLPALVSVAIPADDIQSSALMDKDVIHRLNCVLLGKLVNINRDLLAYVFIISIYPYSMLSNFLRINKLFTIINLFYEDPKT